MLVPIMVKQLQPDSYVFISAVWDVLAGMLLQLVLKDELKIILANSCILCTILIT